MFISLFLMMIKRYTYFLSLIQITKVCLFSSLSWLINTINCFRFFAEKTLIILHHILVPIIGFPALMIFRYNYTYIHLSSYLSNFLASYLSNFLASYLSNFLAIYLSSIYRQYHILVPIIGFPALMIFRYSYKSIHLSR